MFTQWLPTQQTYDGAQLRPHWIAEQTGRFGDAIVAFTGPAAVGAAHMVDLEDVRQRAWIASDHMLHFLVEHFDADLPLMIARQRVLMALCADLLRAHPAAAALCRHGDDLMLGDKKLSVSIATLSPLSGLIHAGLNIVSTNTPVPTVGLANLGVDPQTFARDLMTAYAAEIADMAQARCKVRMVTA